MSPAFLPLSPLPARSRRPPPVRHRTPASMLVRRRAALRLLASVAATGALTSSIPPATSATAPYDAWASDYDSLDARDSLPARLLGLSSLRRALIACARGRVLEVGVGTGANLPLYAANARVTSVAGVDASSGMLARAEEAARTLAGVDLRVADACRLPFGSREFDTVVCTFALCTFEDAGGALLEAKRVLADGGQVLLLEHAASRFSGVRAYQDAVAGVVKAMSKGVRWNMRVERLAEEAGFEVVRKSGALGGTVVSLELGLAGDNQPDVKEG